MSGEIQTRFVVMSERLAVRLPTYYQWAFILPIPSFILPILPNSLISKYDDLL